MTGSVHLFGVRHHGVGSARSLAAALEALQPDCILIEGPPEADDLILLAAHEDMQPPVALLFYNTDQPKSSAWYPFAVFSPEWQALMYALRSGVSVRFFDLPQKHMLALAQIDHPPPQEMIAPSPDAPIDGDDPPASGDGIPREAESKEPPMDIDLTPQIDTYDPLQTLAELAGETDGERWWNRVVEEARNSIEVFEVIHEAMSLLREQQDTTFASMRRYDDLREAHMRKMIRVAVKDHERVAVVCGAWHTPALASWDAKGSAKADNDLLKGLPSVKISATFTPWTYSRLAREAGYGAGIASPGWYQHLWETPPDHALARWLGRVAGLLRDEGLLASTAQVIDAVRLIETLTALRGHGAGLDELNEASVAVLTGGQIEPLVLIRRKLIVGERTGAVPEDAPTVPLQRDLEMQRKRLRLKMAPDPIVMDLDLRNDTDRDRSALFHRLRLLNINWAEPTKADKRAMGTFHEYWSIVWTPEQAIRVIEASVWGSTIESAAISYARDTANEADALSPINQLLNRVMLAALPDVLPDVLRRLDEIASLTHDVLDLLGAIPPLVDTLRYGDVRNTDVTMVAPVLDGATRRASIGLHGATVNINDEAAANLYGVVIAANTALELAERNDLIHRWREALATVAESPSAHPLLAGTAARLLFRASALDASEAARLMRLAFSPGNEPQFGALWLEGFLTSMEHALIRDDALFALVDEWFVGLPREGFEAVLPLLRRTFSTFNKPAKRQLAERIARGERELDALPLDEERAARPLPLLREILGLNG